jgi:translocation and assembly module TamB
MRGLGRILLVSVSGIAGLVITFVGLLFVLGSSDAFLRWVVTLPVVTQVVSLKPEHVHGDLFGPINIDQAVLMTGTWQSEIDGLSLKWQPRELLNKKLVVEALAIRRVTVRQTQASDVATTEDGGWEGFESPLEISLNQLRIAEIELDPPGEPFGRVENLIVSLNLEGDRLELKTLQAQRPEGQVAARGSVVLNEMLPLQLQLDWLTTEAPLSLQGEAKIQGDVNALDVAIDSTGDVEAEAQITLSQLSSPFAFDVNLTVDRVNQTQFNDFNMDAEGWIDSDQNLDVALRWANLTWPTPQLNWQSPTGQTQLRGSFSALAIEGDALVTLQTSTLEPPATQLTYTGRITPEVVAFDAIELSGDMGSGSLAGRYEVASGNAESHGNLQELNTAWLDEQWPGTLDLMFTLQRKQQAWVIDVQELKGSIRNRAVQARVQTRIASDNWAEADIDVDAEIDWGSLSTQAQGGRSADEWQLTFQQSIGDLSELDPRFKGSIEASGALTGAGAAPSLAVQVSADTLSYQAQQLGAVQASLLGALSAEGFDGELSSLGLSSELGEIQMRAAAPLKITRSADSSVGLDAACFDDQRADFCVSLMASGARSYLEADIRSLQLELLDPLMPGLRAQGRIQGAFEVEVKDTEVTGGGALQLASGVLTTASNDSPLLTWESVALDLTAEGGLVGKLRGDLGGEDTLSVDFALTGPGLNVLDAHLVGQTQQLNGLRTIVPEIEPLGGVLRTDIKLSGTRGSPQIDGELAVENASFNIIDLGITANDVNLLANVGPQQLDIDASARVGDGRVAVAGVLDSFVPVRGEFQLQSNDFRFIDSPEAELYGDANLTAVLREPWVEVSGSVSIPRGHIKAVPNTAVTVSEDQMIVGQLDAPDASEPWRAKGALQLSLGPDLALDAVGIQGNVDGTLQLQLPEEGSSRGTGEIHLSEGSFEVFRQKLSIERGALVFSGGPVESPSLDIRASRSIGEQTVGVLARGPAADPIVELFSDPTLSTSDTLSYLTLGKPIGGLAENEQGFINQASDQVAMSGGNLVAAQLGRRIGLDSTSIEGTLDNASLVLGKYLSPRLYVSYGVGIAETVDFLKLRYTLSRRWSLEAESGATSSADLVWSIDR